MFHPSVQWNFFLSRFILSAFCFVIINRSLKVVKEISLDSRKINKWVRERERNWGEKGKRIMKEWKLQRKQRSEMFVHKLWQDCWSWLEAYKKFCNGARNFLNLIQLLNSMSSYNGFMQDFLTKFSLKELLQVFLQMF